jgi:hypothetical protein
MYCCLAPNEGVHMTAIVDTAAARTVRELFAAVDIGDVGALCQHVTDDIRFQFGNAEVTTDKSAFEATSRAFLQSIAAIRHELLDMWRWMTERSWQ